MYERRTISRPRRVSPWIAWSVILGFIVIAAIVIYVVTRKPASAGGQITPEALAARDSWMAQMQKEIDAGTAPPNYAKMLEAMKRVKAGENLKDIAKEARAQAAAEPPPAPAPSGGVRRVPGAGAKEAGAGGH